MRQARPAGIAGVVAVVAIAVLQIAQQAIGAFDPRPVISVLIVVAAAGATFAGARLQEAHAERAARRHLARLLEIAPPRAVGGGDRLALGVLPERRDAAAQAAYIERAIDADVRAAIEPGAIVLVLGERLAGCSRTAFEAARAAQLPVIAPRGPGALAELLALDPPLDAGAGSRILWLDSLERYAEMLDATTLVELGSLGGRPPSRAQRTRPPVDAAVLATARSEDWDALLARHDSEVRVRAPSPRGHASSSCRRCRRRRSSPRLRASTAASTCARGSAPPSPRPGASPPRHRRPPPPATAASPTACRAAPACSQVSGSRRPPSRRSPAW